MNRQLALITTEDDEEAGPDAEEWRIDEMTREIGRRGIAAARQALAAARRTAA